MKCKYCDNEATRTLVWLKDKRRRPARIRLPWCGCDLMVALRRIWACPYQVVEGDDYEVEPLAGAATVDSGRPSADPFRHEVSATCRGEKCSMCGRPATHKVGEEIADDLPAAGLRHNFTAYVCCRHFGLIFGVIAMNWCEAGDLLPTDPPMELAT